MTASEDQIRHGIQRRALESTQLALALERDESENRKAAGIRQVLRNEENAWKKRALHSLLTVALEHREFTADEVRRQIEADGHGEPHHPNVYGALFKRAQQHGIAGATDRTVLSTRPDAHRRRLPVWRSKLIA